MILIFFPLKFCYFQIIIMIKRLLLVSFLLSGCACDDDDVEDLTNFQKMFMQKRIEQLSAVKNILKLEESKRKVLLDQITSKLFQVMLLKTLILMSNKSDKFLRFCLLAEWI